VMNAGCLPSGNPRALDFGSGYVLSDAVALWLLGAQEVVAVDLNPIARREALRVAVASTPFEEVARIAASLPHPLQDVVKDRARRLLSAPDAELEQLPIRYAAPVDILDRSHELGHFDVIWSCSVLEHIPPGLLEPILLRLDELRAPGGQGCHFIDLRDHLDFNRPFHFHSSPEGYEPHRDADARGNGLNVREWTALLSRLPGFELHPVGAPARLSGGPAGSPCDYYEFAVLTHRGRNQ